MKKIFTLLIVGVLGMTLLIGCNSKNNNLNFTEISKDLSFNDIKLIDSTYEVRNKNVGNTKDMMITVELNYDSNIIKTENLSNIKNISVKYLGKKFKQINLIINKNNPKKSIKYVYEEGKWTEGES